MGAEAEGIEGKVNKEKEREERPPIVRTFFLLITHLLHLENVLNCYFYSGSILH